MTASFAAFLGLSLVALLFGVAAATERFGTSSRMGPKFRHGAYTLGLGVYCSSWTFYGAVGTAVSEGWNYLPIYLAPVFLLLAGNYPPPCQGGAGVIHTVDESRGTRAAYEA